MPQPIVGRTEPSSIDAPAKLFSARLYSGKQKSLAPGAKKVFRSLLLYLVSIWITTAMACAQTPPAQQTQPAQIAQTSLSLQCSGQTYEVGLVTAQTTVKEGNAKALGVILSPKEGGGNPKLFRLYWVWAGSKPLLPTHRDNDEGKGGVRPYGDGRIKGKEALASFFDNAKCPPDQVTMAIADVLKRSTVDNDLERVEDRLKAALPTTNITLTRLAPGPAQENQLKPGLRLIAWSNSLREYVNKALSSSSPTPTPSPTASPTPIPGKTPREIGGEGRLLANKLLLWMGFAIILLVITLAGTIVIAHYYLDRRSNQREKIIDELYRRWRQSGELSAAEEGLKGIIEKSLARFSNFKQEMAAKLENKGPMKLNPQTYLAKPCFDEAQKLYNDLCQVKEFLVAGNPSVDAGKAAAQTQPANRGEGDGRLSAPELSCLQSEMTIVIKETVKEALIDITGQLKASDKVRNSMRNLWSEFKFKEKEGKSYYDEGTDELVDQVIKSYNRLHNELEKLRQLYPINSGLQDTISRIIAEYKSIRQDVQKVLPTARGEISTMVSSLTTGYESQKQDYLYAVNEGKRERERAEELSNKCKNLNEQLASTNDQLQASKDLAAEVAQYLNFNAGHQFEQNQPVSRMLEKLKKERKQNVFQQLRMGLSAALTALNKASRSGGSDGQQVVLEALFVDDIKKGLEGLLSKMEGYSVSELWEDGLFPGFNQTWLHYLLRADLILRAYFTRQKGVSFLPEAISLASSAVQAALLELGIELVKIELFEPLPTGVEKDQIHFNLRKLPVVQNLIQERLNKDESLFVVDVISFPIRHNGKQIISGRAAVANPSDWQQNL